MCYSFFSEFTIANLNENRFSVFLFDIGRVTFLVEFFFCFWMEGRRKQKFSFGRNSVFDRINPYFLIFFFLQNLVTCTFILSILSLVQSQSIVHLVIDTDLIIINSQILEHCTFSHGSEHQWRVTGRNKKSQLKKEKQ